MNADKLLVLVVVPSMENAYHGLRRFVAVFPPIGLLSIAACVEATGRRVVIVDGDAENLTMEQVLEQVAGLRPDYVGSTVMTATMDLTRSFFGRLREQLPQVRAIVGGPHVSALPERTLVEVPAIDACVVGEGDETICELLAAFDACANLAGVTGLVWRNGSRVIANAPRPPVRALGQLPLPAFHLLRPELYRSYGWNNWVSGHRSPLGVVFTGRGCIGKCNFCAAHTVFGRGIRYFELEQIQAQIDFLVREWRIKVLYFQDDTFTANRRLVETLCDFLIARGYHRRLEIMVSSRVDTVHPVTLRKMRAAGVRWICFGVESGNARILERMSKQIAVEQIRLAFRQAREAGLFIAGNFMIGHLGETQQTALDTIRLACELDQDYASFAIAIPLPGTELYEHCMEVDLPLPTWNGFGSVNSPPISLNPALDAMALTALRNQAADRFFKRPAYLLGLMRRMRAFAVLFDFVRMYLVLRRERAAKRF